jgi:hypothetical protein
MRGVVSAVDRFAAHLFSALPNSVSMVSGVTPQPDGADAAHVESGGDRMGGLLVAAASPAKPLKIHLTYGGGERGER